MRKYAMVLVLCAFVGAAQASDGDVAAKFGLLGEWAVDCAQSASLQNMRQTFTVGAQESVSATVEMGSDHPPARETLAGLKLLAPDSIVITFTRESDNYVSLVTLKKKGNRTQVIDSTNTATGEALIRDGMLVRAKRPVPWVTKCGK